MKNVLLTIEYDGTNFSGWQRQPNSRTVQGELERVLSHLCKKDVTIDGSGRTDAGVHAYGQCATLQAVLGIPTKRIPQAANNLLKGKGNHSVGDLRILNAQEMPMGFHARFDCIKKKYIYRILNGDEPDIFKRNHCYHVKPYLDFDAMKEAGSYLVGEQDFKTFMASGGKEMETTVRTVFSAQLYERPCLEDRKNKARWIQFEITGDGFLYNMVRIITGTLVDIGTGKIPAKDMKGIIESLNRENAGHTAPPQGLYLAEVYYDLS